MALLLSKCVFLTLVMCINGDGCFERFGSNEAKCMTSEGKCEWLEKDGVGKCMMPAKKDGCFERFGSHKADCTATEGRCLWVEKDGKGKCVMPSRPNHDSKHKDGCYKRFGSDKAACMTSQGKCKWLEKDGLGKCMMPAKKDGCFERFGSHKANCTATEGRCLWVEKDGKGKCVMPSRPNHDSKHRDGCYERFGLDKAACMTSQGKCEWLEKDGVGKCVLAMRSKVEGKNKEGVKTGEMYAVASSEKPQKLMGVLTLSISSLLESIEVLNTFDQHRPLLENAIADSHSYMNVAILDVSPARRLRDAISTDLRIRFEAEAPRSVLEASEAIQSEPALKRILQQSFEKAGLDLQVQSAEVVIGGQAATTSSSHQRAPGNFIKIAVGILAFGLVFICACASFRCMRRRRSSRAAPVQALGKESGENNMVVTPVEVLTIKEKQPLEADSDLASASTGTPSSNGDFAEP